MKLLLDTCTFIWIASDLRRIPPTVCALFADSANDTYLSAVSAWKIAIKHRSEKLRLSNDLPPIDYVREVRRRHRIDTLALDEESSGILKKCPTSTATPSTAC
jgi:PIN domain nuclease of toxin-antitoxin system